MCCTWLFSGHVFGFGLLGETKYAALSCLPVDLFCVSAGWIAFLFKSFLILTKTIAVLWCQGIPEVTATLYILWFTALFASWKPQFVLVHFPCFVWVSGAPSAPPEQTGLGIFSCSIPFPSAVLMLQNYKFLRTWGLSLLVFPFPAAVDDTGNYPELLFAWVFHLALLAVDEKRVRNTQESFQKYEHINSIDWKNLPLSSWYFPLQLGS